MRTITRLVAILLLSLICAGVVLADTRYLPFVMNDAAPHAQPTPLPDAAVFHVTYIPPAGYTCFQSAASVVDYQGATYWACQLRRAESQASGMAVFQLIGMNGESVFVYASGLQAGPGQLTIYRDRLVLVYHAETQGGQRVEVIR